MIPFTRCGRFLSQFRGGFRRWSLGVGLLCFLAWLGANLLVCEFQIRCLVPVSRAPWLGTLMSTQQVWLAAWLASLAVLTVVGVGLEWRWRRRSPQTLAMLVAQRTLRLVRVIYHLLAWLLLLAVVSLGFLVARRLFFEMLLCLSLVGIAQGVSRRMSLSAAGRRAVYGCVLMATAGLLAARFWSLSFVTVFPRPMLLMVCLFTVVAGTGLARVLTPHPRGLRWYAHQARCASLFVVSGFIALSQLIAPNALCCLSPASRTDVRLMLKAERAFDVLTCTDPRFLYVSFDHHGKLVRVALDPARDGPPRTLEVGSSGVIRPVCDRAHARLFVPVLVPGGPSRLLELDEATFRVVREILTPQGNDYRIFDIALDRVGRQVLALTKAGYILSYRFGASGFTKLAELARWFAIPYGEHFAIRVAVNEQRRVAYICPWPSTSTKLVELDLHTGRVIRRRELYDFASDVKVIRGGRELLVALPFRQEVQRLDAASLRLLRRYPAGFSTRDLAVDEERGLLLVGNFITGTVNLIRLADGHNLRNWYVGPALRGVHLDAGRGLAFAATQCGASRIRLP